MSKRSLVIFFQGIIAVLLIAILYYKVGFKQAITILQSADGFFVSLSVLFFLLYFFSSAINTWLLLNGLYKISFTPFLKAYSSSFLFSLFAFGQLGDASLLYFLHRQKIPVKISTAAYSLDKFFSIAFMLSIATIGATQILPSGSWTIYVIVLISFFIAVLIIFYLVKALNRNTPVIGKVISVLNNAFRYIVLYRNRPRYLFINLTGQVLKWALVSLCYYFAFRSFGAEIKLIHAACLPNLASLAGYIPISLNGIGVVESYAVYLFSKVNIAAAITLNSYIFVRLLLYLFALLLYLYYFILKQSFRNSGNELS